MLEMKKDIQENADALKITPDEYRRFCEFLEKTCGIVLGENKEYLINSRLFRFIQERGIKNISELLGKLTGDTTGKLKEWVVDAMTTNETFWFRDMYPFEALKNAVFPELADKGLKQVKIWSAACSTGQEPYSIAITAHEYLTSKQGQTKFDVKITGTDISSSVLMVARQGIYDYSAVTRGLPIDKRNQYFYGIGNTWQIKDDIRRMVTIKEFNLMNDYRSLGKFHIIFCRNVMIYFSSEMKKMMLAKLANMLEPGGYLFVGSTEGMAGYSDSFESIKYEKALLYRLKK